MKDGIRKFRKRPMKRKRRVLNNQNAWHKQRIEKELIMLTSRGGWESVGRVLGPSDCM